MLKGVSEWSHDLSVVMYGLRSGSDWKLWCTGSGPEVLWPALRGGELVYPRRPAASDGGRVKGMWCRWHCQPEMFSCLRELVDISAAAIITELSTSSASCLPQRGAARRF